MFCRLTDLLEICHFYLVQVIDFPVLFQWESGWPCQSLSQSIYLVYILPFRTFHICIHIRGLDMFLRALTFLNT